MTIEYIEPTSERLTKREHIAAMALQGLLSSGRKMEVSELMCASIQAADALLSALKERS
jgi:hypothetical protein